MGAVTQHSNELVAILDPAMVDELIERVRPRALAYCAACFAGVVVIGLLFYWVPFLERLDRDLLNAINSPSGSTAHDIAWAIERPMEPIGWALASAVAFLIASYRGLHKRALLAVALIVGTAVIDLVFKEVFEHRREPPAPVMDFDWFPTPSAYPSGHAAGSLAIALAFVFVVPSSWQRATAAIGIAFTLLVTAGLLVLNWHYPGDIPGGWLLALGWCFALLAVEADRDPPRTAGADP